MYFKLQKGETSYIFIRYHRHISWQSNYRDDPRSYVHVIDNYSITRVDKEHTNYKYLCIPNSISGEW